MHCENFKKIQDRKGKSNNNAYQRRKKKVVLPLIPEKEDNFSVWKNGKNALNTIINLNDFPVLDCYKNHKSKLKKECCKITPSQNIDLPHTNTNDRNIQNQALPTLPSQISEENHVSDEQGYEIVQESLETLIQNVSGTFFKTFFKNNCIIGIHINYSNKFNNFIFVF